VTGEFFVAIRNYPDKLVTVILKISKISFRLPLFDQKGSRPGLTALAFGVLLIGKHLGKANG